ncbi:MAG: hypothetical protein ABIU09_09385 [Pyrinomonadaceae bacterium]
MNREIWKYAIMSAAAALVLALYPQISLWVSQGANWNGSYFVSNYDEVAYSAYVNALINGEPRKNDPFLGLRDTPDTPQPETLYSIQFIPAYAIALPARLLGLSTSTAFIFLIAFTAVFSALVLFWLIREATRDDLLSAVGAIAVLCWGTALAFQGELRYLIEGRVLADFFPYLRRYQPGFAFPIFYVFCILVWRATRVDSSRRVIAYAAAGGCAFAILIYSYFYLWTAAAAWLVCFTLISVISDKAEWKKSATLWIITGTIGAAALIPYFYLLSLRSRNLDSIQLLTYARVPEFASPSMIIGLVVAGAAIIAIRRGAVSMPDKRIPLLLSFALTPVILFNQQIITGRSLQPVHYELFIANYLVLTAAVLLLSVAISRKDFTKGFRRGLLYIGIAAIGWGFFEAYGSTSRNSLVAEIRDASIPAVRAVSRESTASPAETLVLATNFVTADFIPSILPIRSLWNPHTTSAGGIDTNENKRLFYLYLYYSGYGEGDLADALNSNSFEVTAAIFGSERALPSLAQTSASLSKQEIRSEVEKYAEFARQFDRQTAGNPTLDHLIVPAEAEPDFANIDRWYERDSGQTFGLFRLYKLTPRPPG